MSAKPKTPDSTSALRQKAEQLAAERQASMIHGREAGDAQRLLHELDVYQIELEMQNAELRLARDEAETVLEKFTDLYEFAPVAYFTLDPKGSIHLVNLTGSQLVGSDRARLIGKSFKLLLAPEFRSLFEEFLNQVFADQTKHSLEIELLRKDRSPVAVNIDVQRSPNGRECRVVATDITERKRAQITANWLASIVESSDDAIVGKNLHGIITNWNRGAEKIFGYTAAEMVGTSITRLIPADRPDEENQILSRIRSGESITHFETQRTTKDGRLIDVSVTISPIRNANDKIIGVSKVARDISAAKRAEEILRRNEALFSALVQQAPLGVYVVDARFRLQQANPIAMAVFANVTPLIDRDFAEVIHILWPKHVADQVTARFRHTLKTGEPYHSPEFAERRRDIGLKEFYEWQIQRVTLPAGEYGVVCFFSNITERIRAETAKRRMEVLTASNLKLKQEIVRRQAVEEVLHQTEQQQSKLLKQSHRQREQLRDLSHQILQAQEEERKRISRELHDVIAQTLVSINVHMAALSQGAADTPRSLQQKIARTRQLVENSVAIVHQFARELRPTMLDDLGLIPALHAYLKRFMEDTGIRASLKSFAGLEQATGTVERTMLYRVAQEALTNVARHAKASQVEVSLQNLKGNICLEITDNGEGFEVAATTRAKKDTRLGLLGMKERVEMIGGTFTVESAPGQPTTVRVEIAPASRTTPKRPSKSRPSPP